MLIFGNVQEKWNAVASEIQNDSFSSTLEIDKIGQVELNILLYIVEEKYLYCNFINYITHVEG